MSVHGNEKYDFSLAVYRNNRSQVLILCHKHGAFNIKAEVFMQGHGCKTYGDIYRHTMSREIEIRNAGYMVVTIWESEWLDYKSSNKVA